MTNELAKNMDKAVKEEIEKQKQWREQTTEGISEEWKKIKTTLQDVYDTTEKWLGITKWDRNRIDVILATALSNQIEGTPIWIFFVGASGDWKTTFCQSLGCLPNVIKIDQITKNTLASGMKDAHDLGHQLQHSSHILLFLDLASLTSANTDEKNAIWSQFRCLFDGDIFKRTGNTTTEEKAYEGCHVTIIAGTTSAIRNEILIHAQLGTRELMFDTNSNPIDNNFKMDMAIKNEQYEQLMRKEIGEVVSNFLIFHKVKDIDISKENLEFLKSEAQRLTILRASGMVDRYYRELINPIEPEVPTRVIKQFVRIWRCLKSLDDNYPDKKCKEIISHIVDSSGDKVRQIVLEVLQKEKEKLKISTLQQRTKLGRNTVKSQCEMLWNLGVINKELIEERIGGYPGYNEQGTEVLKGGRIEEVAYYQFNEVKNYEQKSLQE